MANITSGARLFGDLQTTEWPHYANAVQNGTATAYMLGKEVPHTSTDTSHSTPSVATQSAQRPSLWQFGGSYKVVGKVEINTVVVAGKWVYIFPEGAPALCIGAQYTDSTGNFSFIGLAPGKYKVYAMDPNFNYNGKLYENISAVAM